MRLDKKMLFLEEFILENNDETGWTVFPSLAEMFEKIQVKKLGAGEPLKLEFASLTTFSRGSQKNTEYGNHYARLPLPQYVFPYLAKRWQELAPPELAHLVQREQIEQYAHEEGIIITDYDLKPHIVKFNTHWQQGFICT